jgi:cardiolipin synthase
MRSVLLLFLGALLAGCATLPDVHPWSRPSDTDSKPTIVGSRGQQLKPEQIAKVLARIRGNSDSDLLEKHIAIEEEIAGRPLTVGNSATLLRDGPASYQAMFDAIAAARDHVNVEFYIIEDDEVGRRFSEALIAKAAEGVAVNLMYDSVGSNQASPGFFERLRQGGVNVLEFNPVNPLRARGAWRANNRDHRKLVIVDGRVAFTGGINISNVYSASSGRVGGSRSGGSGPSALGSSGASGGGGLSGSRSASSGPPRPIGWRDTNVRLQGPAVGQLQQLFLETWALQKGPPLAEREWFPAGTRQGDHPARIIASGPGDQVPAIYVALLSAIAYAEKSVHITMAYFVPDPQTIKALKDAAARGVDVTLVLPSYTDFWAVFHAGRSHYAELLDAGVKIYERQEALLHAKTIVIDGVWSTVGSSNLDWRSFLHNAELNAVILGGDFGKQMEAMFERDLRGSVRITRETWNRRPVEVRMKEFAARFWEYWL